MSASLGPFLATFWRMAGMLGSCRHAAQVFAAYAGTANALRFGLLVAEPVCGNRGLVVVEVKG
jgi:hypothetical protein